MVYGSLRNQTAFFVSSVEIYLTRVYVAMRVNLERVLREELDNPVYIGKIAYGKSANEKVKGTRDCLNRLENVMKK